MRAGDHLVLTKPLGLGIITTAIKREVATPELVERAIGVMTTLNRAASEAAVEVGVSAATDVTGFGLPGHLRIALEGSKMSARVDAAAIQILPGAIELAEAGVIPGGTRSNHAFVDPLVDWGELPEPEQLVLADAQTSGGLLLSVPAAKVTALLDALESRGVDGMEIGTVSSEDPRGAIQVTGRLTRP
jgi:selenide,water dikinase